MQTVEVDSRSAAAPAMALARGADQVSRAIAEPLARYATKLQEVENWHTLAKKRMKMQESYAAYQIQAEESGMAPGDMLKNWRKQMDTLQVEVMDSGLPRAVQDRLTVDWDEFAGRTSIDIAKTASQKGIEQAQQTFENEYVARGNAGDTQGQHSLVDEYQAVGGMDLPTADRMHSEIESNGEVMLWEQTAEEEPKLVAEALKERDENGLYVNSPGMDVGARKQLIRKAEMETQRFRREDQDEVELLIKKQDLVSVDQLKKMREKGEYAYMEDNDWLAAEAMLDKSEVPTDAERVAVEHILSVVHGKLGLRQTDPAEYAKLYNSSRAEIARLAGSYAGIYQQRLAGYSLGSKDNLKSAQTDDLVKFANSELSKHSRSATFVNRTGSGGAANWDFVSSVTESVLDKINSKELTTTTQIEKYLDEEYAKVTAGAGAVMAEEFFDGGVLPPKEDKSAEVNSILAE